MSQDMNWEAIRDMTDQTQQIQALKSYIESRPDTKQRRRAQRLLDKLQLKGR